ncbi:hypothetical protein OG390_22235 [Streptomyces sp. NBC_00996]|nr:hypothetical protein OG390_22235 [Streptomyces sp. NBC_00996]
MSKRAETVSSRTPLMAARFPVHSGHEPRGLPLTVAPENVTEPKSVTLPVGPPVSELASTMTFAEVGVPPVETWVLFSVLVQPRVTSLMVRVKALLPR